MKNYYKTILSKLNSLNYLFNKENGKDKAVSYKTEVGDFGLTCEFIKEKQIKKTIIYVENILQLTDNGFEYYIKYVQIQLEKFVGKLNKNTKILIVGMGNSFITADSLGSKIAEKLEPTRHLKYKTEFQNIPSLSIFLPSVLGVTGIETADSINAICSIVKPDIIIAIDALCASDISRFCTTIQFSSDGVTPGAGVGNNRKKINNKNLGTKVVAIGVPLLIEYCSMAKKDKNLNSYQEILTCADINNIIDKFAFIISSAISNMIVK